MGTNPALAAPRPDAAILLSGIDRVRVPLEDWVVQIPIDLGLVGSNRQVEVLEVASGGRTVRRTSQLDRAGATAARPGVGTLSWSLDGTTAAGQERRFEVRALPGVSGGTPRSSVTVRRDAAGTTIVAPRYTLVLDGRTGLLREVLLRGSGRRIPIRSEDAITWESDGLRERIVWAPAESKVAVVADGPVRTVVTAETDYQARGRRGVAPIRVVYEYTIFPALPVVGVRVFLPSQPLARTISQMTFLRLRFEPGTFGRWAVGGHAGAGPLSGNEQGHGMAADPGGAPWGAVIAGNEAFGLMGQELGAIQDRKGATIFSSYATAPWRGAPWRGEARVWSSFLYLGPSDPDGRPVAEAARAVRGYRLWVTTPSLVSQAGSVQRKVSNLRTGAGTPRVFASIATMLVEAAAAHVTIRGDVSTADALAAWAGRVADDAASRTPAQAPVALRNGSFVVMANESVSLLIRTSSPAELLRVFNNATGASVLGLAPAERPVWEIVLRSSNSGTVRTISSAATTGPAVASLRPSGDSVVLAWEWPGVRFGDQGGGVTVTATVSLFRGDPVSRWRLRLAGPTRPADLYSIDFPVVGPLGVDSGTEQPDALVLPMKSGLMIRDPAMSGSDELTYPGDARLQLLPYWRGRNGLYLATHDPEARVKRFRIVPTPNGFEVRVSYLVPAGAALQDAAAPYDSMIGVFSGDWYDAAKRYRDWALKQKWVPRAPLRANPDIPTWFKDVHVTVRPSGDPAVILPSVEELRKAFAMPVLVNWYGWKIGRGLYAGSPDVAPKPGFREAVERLRRDQSFVVPFMPFLLWDTRAESWRRDSGEAAAVVDENGGIRIRREGDTPAAVMCPGSALWRQKVRQTLGQILGAGEVSGVYLDLAGTPRPWTCNGGGAGHVQDMRALISLLREEGRRRNPDFVVLSEYDAEPYLDLIDGYLIYHSVLEDLLPLNVPMFQAVYADYMRPYGAKSLGLRDKPVDALLAAQLFTFGGRIGRVFGAAVLKDRPEFARYLIRLAQHRRSAAPYLAYGEMVRPLQISYVSPATTELQRASLAIQTSSWRAPDGTVGFVFTNATVASADITFRVRIDPREYAVPADGSYALFQIAPDGTKMISRMSGPVDWQGTLPSLGILVLVLQPDRR